MTSTSRRSIRLARTLRELRESGQSEELTQVQLAKALSGDSRVAAATLSSWESLTNPKTPPPSRLTAYARFFATPRSLEGGPHLIPEKDLRPDELERFRELEEELLDHLRDEPERHRTFAFPDGAVTIVCPRTPDPEQGPLADLRNPNFTKLRQYADQDALLELWGHLRAENPALTAVRHCLPEEAKADDFSANVILLGGIGWNQVTRRFQAALSQLPIKQVDDERLDSGETFVVTKKDGEEAFFLPEWDGDDLVEDVAMLARLRNPFKISRTLTLCNGIHSRGVLGAVRCLTDAQVSAANEEYLAERFPEGTFAMLLRVPVYGSETVSPDLQNPDVRLYEWPGPDGSKT